MSEEDRTHEDAARTTPREEIPSDENPSDEQPAPSTPTPEVVRPTGISWVTVTFGLLCLGVSGLVLTLQLSELNVDWGLALPGFVISAGVVLMVLGAVALTKGRADREAL
ncbi:MAG: hypothetical protein WBG89_09930 [Ornithinimicrobium sp.]